MERPSALAWRWFEECGVLTAVQKRWRWLLWGVVGGAACGVGASQVLPRWYATSVELATVPVDDPTTPGLTNAVEGAGAELPLLVAVLRSRKLADQAVQRFDLLGAYGTRSVETARNDLARHVRINIDRKANVVTVEVEDQKPQRALELARFFGEAADAQSGALWSSRTREHRARLETRLAEVAQALNRAEEEMQAFGDRHRVVQLDEQVKATVAEAAAVEHLQIEKSLSLHFAQGFGAGDSSEVRRARREAAGVQHAMSSLIRNGRRNGALLALDELPALERAHARLERQVAVQRAGYELLAKQVEQLRAVELRPVGRVAVLDPPFLPERAARPDRVLLVLESAILGLLLSLLGLLTQGSRRMERVEADEEQETPISPVVIQ